MYSIIGWQTRGRDKFKWAVSWELMLRPLCPLIKAERIAHFNGLGMDIKLELATANESVRATAADVTSDLVA